MVSIPTTLVFEVVFDWVYHRGIWREVFLSLNSYGGSTAAQLLRFPIHGGHLAVLQVCVNCVRTHLCIVPVADRWWLWNLWDPEFHWANSCFHWENVNIYFYPNHYRNPFYFFWAFLSGIFIFVWVMHMSLLKNASDGSNQICMSPKNLVAISILSQMSQTDQNRST